MKEKDTQTKRILLHSATVFLCLFTLAFNVVRVPAQATAESADIPSSATAASDDTGADGFRIEKIRIEGGAELITILAKNDVHEGDLTGPASEIPLVSILRDTLGDEEAANDRLRYVWMLTY